MGNCGDVSVGVTALEAYSGAGVPRGSGDLRPCIAIFLERVPWYSRDCAELSISGRFSGIGSVQLADDNTDQFRSRVPLT